MGAQFRSRAGCSVEEDARSKPQKKQAAIPKRLEQKFEEEPKSDEGRATQECDKEAMI